MFKLSCIFLLQVLLAANAEVVNVNKNIDQYLAFTNNYLREKGATSGAFPELKLSPNVSYSDATIIGIDSLVRTGDCWVDSLDSNEIKLTSHYGFELFTIVFPHLTLYGEKMSGLLRIRNNSIYISYTTLYQNDKCTTTLDEHKFERLQNIEFQSSIAKYDGKNLENFFQTHVIPAFNGMLLGLKPQIEAGLQALCDRPPHHHSTIEALLSQFISLN